MRSPPAGLRRQRLHLAISLGFIAAMMGSCLAGAMGFRYWFWTFWLFGTAACVYTFWYWRRERKERRAIPSKRRVIVGVLIVVVVATALWWRQELAIDACLDGGGRWDFANSRCDQ